jgi:hypothetical protein
MSDETFDVWPHDPTKIVKEALREYVGDGDGEDERVLAAHEERVRAEERERIARVLREEGDKHGKGSAHLGALLHDIADSLGRDVVREGA